MYGTVAAQPPKATALEPWTALPPLSRRRPPRWSHGRPCRRPAAGAAFVASTPCIGRDRRSLAVKMPPTPRLPRRSGLGTRRSSSTIGRPVHLLCSVPLLRSHPPSLSAPPPLNAAGAEPSVAGASSLTLRPVSPGPPLSLSLAFSFSSVLQVVRRGLEKETDARTWPKPRCSNQSGCTATSPDPIGARHVTRRDPYGSRTASTSSSPSLGALGSRRLKAEGEGPQHSTEWVY
jgi:hypothetical protein